jgi:YD repeat-containing protein
MMYPQSVSKETGGSITPAISRRRRGAPRRIKTPHSAPSASEVRNVFGNRYKFFYDAAGRLESLAVPGGWETYTYDDDGRRTARVEQAGATTLHDDDFTYDNGGHVRAVTGTGGHGWTVENVYTGSGGLLATDLYDNGGLPHFIEEYQTDGLGNVSAKRVDEGVNDPESAYEYDDFSGLPDRIVVETLATCSFVRAKVNVLFLGPPGVGKSHLAAALGVKAIKNGFSVVHFVLDDLMHVLKADAAIPPARLRAKRYLNAGLVIVDEVGFRSLDRAADGCVKHVDPEDTKPSRAAPRPSDSLPVPCITPRCWSLRSTCGRSGSRTTFYPWWLRISAATHLILYAPNGA